MKKINFINLRKENSTYFNQFKKHLSKSLKDSNFILGNDLETFEKNLAKYLGVKYAISVSNGTIALYLALKSLKLNKNDEVITVANSYLSTVSSIIAAGATPVLSDVNETLNICPIDLEKKITKKTKVILPVHLTGNPSDMIAIKKIAKKYKLKIIEDCAQAIGASINKKKVGNFGELGCFSFHPLKNLSGIGDGGAIVCNSKKIYNWLLLARNNGHPSRDECNLWSMNFRLDSFKAKILNEKLKKINNINHVRNRNAQIYYKNLNHHKSIKLIKSKKKFYNVFHLMVIRVKKRSQLIKFLKSKKIETKIHYPKPVHKQRIGIKTFNTKLRNTEKYSKEILSLPINQFLKSNEINYICRQITKFYS